MIDDYFNTLYYFSMLSNFWIISAFSKKLLEGNPAAVILMDEYSPKKQLELIAKEISQPATAFIKKISDSHTISNYDIRFFTQNFKEIDICGHAILAASSVIFSELTRAQKVRFNSKLETFTVTKNKQEITLSLPVQKVGKPITNSRPYENAFSIKKEQVLGIYKAEDDILIELDSEKSLSLLEPDWDRIYNLEEVERGVILTSKSESGYDFVSRFFSPKLGVLEDNVCGSAHCKLVDFWFNKLKKHTFCAYQMSQRGAELKLKIKNNRLLLAGNAEILVKGYISPLCFS